ncbi:dienelactone hydrolase family protein [Nocardia seriolae]|uniref:Carboxymethylenebutenolidase n=1 Tax=Nocardia seriolae TaxID=37332 RepID=A0A0B8NB91_9NOCA|nr:dienelactone hydrolase family protein [Nocardia seriolae]APB00979.1 Carboxymethylenebutenolidase [Nocardia seriolae]MTJ65521.1 dienelactone hydrolase family protein [Nocardia seriolae]MTJ74544.1 dienelactone hydrolase family protein [Nocardia seriolae]MTJ90400.1 dienelactone hydrolase family protein [Nocardia seriolae]MTK34362.1 dienelactone hydrolase family protein [Nocardia seriolae]
MSDAAIVTEWIDLKVGESVMTAYAARPAEPGRYPGVVVAHEIYGLHGTARAAVERLASLGVVAVMPDLFHRADPRAELELHVDRDRGLELLRTLSRPGVVDDVSACLDELRRRDVVSLNMVGFSAGGHAAYYAATQLPLAATAAFYPGWLTDTDIPLSTPEPTVEATPGITGRVVLFFGGADPLIDAEARDELEEALSVNDIQHEIVVYQDAPHAFLFPGRESYRPEIAEDSWARLADLLRAG